MNSGEWITFFLLFSLVAFVVWEFTQLYRRRQGNRSARTMSQYVIHRVRAGSSGWKWFVLLFPIFITLVGIWLLFHWEAPCFWFDVLCDLDV